MTQKRNTTQNHDHQRNKHHTHGQLQIPPTTNRGDQCQHGRHTLHPASLRPNDAAPHSSGHELTRRHPRHPLAQPTQNNQSRTTQSNTKRTQTTGNHRDNPIPAEHDRKNTSQPRRQTRNRQHNNQQEIETKENAPDTRGHTTPTNHNPDTQRKTKRTKTQPTSRTTCLPQHTHRQHATNECQNNKTACKPNWTRSCPTKILKGNGSKTTIATHRKMEERRNQRPNGRTQSAHRTYTQQTTTQNNQETRLLGNNTERPPNPRH